MPTSFQWLGQGETGGDWMAPSATPGIYWGSTPIIGHTNSKNQTSLTTSQQTNTGYSPGILTLLDSGNVLVGGMGILWKMFINLFSSLGMHRVK